ncbi:MAG: preQ(1) synthase [Verrucomicrobiales bacterium]
MNRLPGNPDDARLEVFPNRNAHRNYWIELAYPEFSSLCPVTGQPDSAALEIQYVPGDVCVETKSLKFYLASFRNHAAFNEDIVNRILDDLCAACSPRRMAVKGKFSPRGGVQLTATASFPDAIRTDAIRTDAIRTDGGPGDGGPTVGGPGVGGPGDME